MAAEIIAGVIIGAGWTLIIGSVVIGALRDQLGPVRIERVPVHPDTFQPWSNYDWLIGVVAAVEARCSEEQG